MQISCSSVLWLKCRKQNCWARSGKQDRKPKDLKILEDKDRYQVDVSIRQGNKGYAVHEGIGTTIFCSGLVLFPIGTLRMRRESRDRQEPEGGQILPVYQVKIIPHYYRVLMREGIEAESMEQIRP